MTTFPTCFCDSRYSKASFVSSKEKTLSTFGWILLTERRRFMSLNLWECDTRMRRINTGVDLLRKRSSCNPPQHRASTNNCKTGMYCFVTLENALTINYFLDNQGSVSTDFSNGTNTVNPTPMSHGLERFWQSARTTHLNMNQTKYKRRIYHQDPSSLG